MRRSKVKGRSRGAVEGWFIQGGEFHPGPVARTKAFVDDEIRIEGKRKEMVQVDRGESLKGFVASLKGLVCIFRATGG